MKVQHLHIISFDIPWPPVYGGVIDVFHQIRTLSEAGIQIHLHAFEYGKGKRSPELENLCFSVNYYSRTTELIAAIHWRPYITQSRKSPLMIHELLKDNYPILFEGLHCCYYLSDERLRDRLKLFRATNIEHSYYLQLAKAERNLFRKVYHLMAALKLKFFQKVIRHADVTLAVSPADTLYFQSKFSKLNTLTVPCFHPKTQHQYDRSGGEYVLFHGNLEVAENEKAAVYLMDKVMNDTDIPFIIAGNNPSRHLYKKASRHPNVTIAASPDAITMSQLIHNARINLLITFQATGLKLKLLNALYNGGYVIVNDKMVKGSGLETLCFTGNIPSELKQLVQDLVQKEFTLKEYASRMTVLSENFDNTKHAEKIIELLS